MVANRARTSSNAQSRLRRPRGGGEAARAGAVTTGTVTEVRRAAGVERLPHLLPRVLVGRVVLEAGNGSAVCSALDTRLGAAADVGAPTALVVEVPNHSGPASVGHQPGERVNCVCTHDAYACCTAVRRR